MPRRNRFIRRALMALGLSTIALLGCGGGADVKGLVPVSGRVTLDGGAWPKPGKITFVPVGKGGEGQTEVRPASADFGTDGNFTVSSFDGAPGLFPGEYWISIECWEVLPGMGNPDAAKEIEGKKNPVAGPGKSVVPKMYQNHETSKMSLKVEPGQKPAANFDIKTK